MTLDLWLKVLNAVVIVGSVLINAYLFMKSKTDERFAELDTALAEYDHAAHIEVAERKAFDNELERRLVVIETEIRAMPTHDDLEEIHRALSNVRSDLATVNERSRGTLDGVRRIEQHLLERSR